MKRRRVLCSAAVQMYTCPTITMTTHTNSYSYTLPTNILLQSNLEPSIHPWMNENSLRDLNIDNHMCSALRCENATWNMEHRNVRRAECSRLNKYNSCSFLLNTFRCWCFHWSYVCLDISVRFPFDIFIHYFWMHQEKNWSVIVESVLTSMFHLI